MKKSFEIKAILDSELDELLENLGLLEQIQSGKLSCAICGRKITRANFFCLFVRDGMIKLCCDLLACYEQAIMQPEEGKNA